MNMRNISTALRTIGIASALTLASGAVNAAIPAFLSNNNSVRFSDGAVHVVPLSNAGATSIAFTSSGPGQRTMISYNAECSVVGDELTNLDINIKVDGVSIAPSLGDNAFCSGIGTDILGHQSSNVTNVVVRGLQAGAHSVTVEAQLGGFDAGEFVDLDDSITILQR